jgi:hypothetical protein
VERAAEGALDAEGDGANYAETKKDFDVHAPSPTSP